MHKSKTLLVLALAALFILACSLSNGSTRGAATLATPGASPTTERIDAIPSPSPPEHCTVTTGAKDGRLNLRSCPGTDCEVLAVLDEGDHLQVIDAGDWLNVQTDTGAAGFVHSNYCEVTK